MPYLGLGRPPLAGPRMAQARGTGVRAVKEGQHLREARRQQNERGLCFSGGQQLDRTREGVGRRGGWIVDGLALRHPAVEEAWILVGEADISGPLFSAPVSTQS